MSLLRQTATAGAPGAFTSVGTVMNMQYNCTAGADNGQIASSVDAVTGETVTYQYDALKRLVSAYTTSGSWQDNYTYDGFGNLTGMTPVKGTPPQLSVGVNWQTNRITPTGVSYDNNGNGALTGNSATRKCGSQKGDQPTA